jgi:hypothetical protein
MGILVFSHESLRCKSFKLAESFCPMSALSFNMALNRAPYGRWTLRDKAAQRRLALR